MGKSSELHRGHGLRGANRDLIDEPELKTIEVDGVYDIETQAWTRFVCGGVLTRNGFHSFTYRREEEFVDLLLSLSGRFFAHNGGRYDALWFLGHIRKRGIKATCYGQGQRITNLRVGDLILCDSYALVPMALKEGAKLGRYQKSDTGLQCVCLENCGGYCAISRNMPPHLMKKLIEYLENDCKATLSMLDAVVEFAAANDLDLAYTIGGSSWATAKRRVGLTKADWSWGSRGQSAATLYAFARGAYFGGRTQVFRPLVPTGYRYDVNSAYPAALASLKLPWGSPRELVNRAAGRAYDDGREGLFRARIRVPECHIPPLPVRGKLRLWYPHGIVDGTWAGNEIRYAEEMGCRVERIRSCLAWDSSEVVFASLCRHVWDLRHKVGPKTPWGKWLKWFANSLTGRLAIKPEAETIYIQREPNGARFCPADWDCKNGRRHHSSRRRCCPHYCTRRCGVVLPLGMAGHASGVWSRRRFQIADSAHVHYAAYLTAHARVQLHRQLTDYGNDDGWSAVYCDTDSCYSVTPRTHNVGEGLGEWDYEGEFAPGVDEEGNRHDYGFAALAPKTYAYLDVKRRQLHARSKGVYLGDAEQPTVIAQNWDTLVNGGSVTMARGVKSLRSALREDDDFFTRKSITRRVLGTEDVHGVRWFGDRYLGDDDCTHPINAQDGGKI